MKVYSNTEWLFNQLWSKSPDSQQSCPGISLAETVIYKWAQPYLWYYSDEGGQMIRKTKVHIDGYRIKGHHQSVAH